MVPSVHSMPSLSAANAALVFGERGTRVASAIQKIANTNTIDERLDVSFMLIVLRSEPE
jgi:hypothetical protein